MNNRNLCIYHGNCADGFAAAWVVRKWMLENCPSETMDYYPGVYQEPPPNCKGYDVVIVDFSYKRPVMEKILEECESLIWIDHHQTAIADMWGFGILSSKFISCTNLNFSGAMLTWLHYFPGRNPPQLLKHIEDRDLWRFKLPGTREIQANVFSYPYDFKIWDTLMDIPTVELLRDGAAIERKHFKDVDELIKVTVRPMLIGTTRVPVCNLPYTMASDAGHTLCKMWELGELKNLDFHPGFQKPFAATYYDKSAQRVFSLRSLEGGEDVSLIAKQYGGGGHKHAAGFAVPKDSELGRA